MKPVNSNTISSFLLCETPDAWLDKACENEALLLIDHANCEKKAASTAINLIYRYVERPGLMLKLSKLAREELRHFEQVLGWMKRRDVTYEQISSARYAGSLRKLVRTWEPARLVDILICGAVVEARSCERFQRLVPVLDTDLGRFYDGLCESESRHFEVYLDFAREISRETSSDDSEFEQQVHQFLLKDAELIQSTDDEFRFHSGVPA